jgi:WD40 repeat protein
MVMPPIDAPFLTGSAAISPDHRSLAVAGGDRGDVVVYSIPDGREVGRLDGLSVLPEYNLHRDTAALAYVADGSLLVGSLAGPVRVVDPQTLAVRRTLDAPEATTSGQLLLGADPTLLLGAGPVGVVRLDLASGTTRWALGLDDINVHGCVAAALRRCWSRSGVSTAATGSAASTSAIWRRARRRASVSTRSAATSHRSPPSTARRRRSCRSAATTR